MKREHCTATIVLLGSFRPDDFLPKRLVEKKIISSKDGLNAEFISLLPGQVSQFKLPWATLLITDDRLQIATTDVPFVRISDLVRKALGELETECVITAMGINFDAHYDVGSCKERDKVALKIAPAEGWGDWGGAIRESMRQDEKDADLSMHGGVMSQTMRLPFRTDNGLRGWRDVTIEPSNIIDGETGIWLRTNHHHALDVSPDLESKKKLTLVNAESVEKFLTRLDDFFDASIAEADQIFNGVLGL